MLFFALYARAEAATLDVCASGCAYSTITSALGEAVSGDVLEISAGLYQESIVINIDLTLRGIDGALLTTIEASADAAVRIAPGVAASIEDLTLSGAGLYPALTVGSSAQASLLDVSLADGIGSSGGCASVDTAGSLVATASVFSGCTSLDAGGALVGYDAILSMTDCTFDGSEALWGGAIAAYGGEVTLDSTQISGNHANDGGAIWANGAQVSISSAVFDGNTAGSPQVPGYGGAIWASAGELSVSDSTFEGNATTGWGSAIYTNDMPYTVYNTAFLGNDADYSGTTYQLFGSGRTSITNSSYIGNTGGDGGGIVWFGGGSGELLLEGSRFEGNYAENQAGALYVENCGDVFASDNVFADNGALNVAGAVWAGALWGNSCAHLEFVGNRFCGNTATHGGAAWLTDRSSLADNLWSRNIFAENAASVAGGALYLEAAPIQLTNNDLLANTAPSGGGLWTDGPLDLDNNLVAWQQDGYGIFADGIAPAELSVEHSALWDNAPADLGGVLSAPSATSTLAEPMLAWSPGDGCDGNFAPLPGSPLVDGGDPSTPDPDGTPVDIGAIAGPPAVDEDGDGFLPFEDCDDGDMTVHIGADETCDGRDEDCDGEIDEDAVDAVEQLVDADGDGYAGEVSSGLACGEPALAGDCDDSNSDVNPSAEELPGDSIDNDCVGGDAPASEDEGTPDTGEPKDKQGCGCSSGARPLPGVLAGLLFLSSRRKRA